MTARWWLPHGCVERAPLYSLVLPRDPQGYVQSHMGPSWVPPGLKDCGNFLVCWIPIVYKSSQHTSSETISEQREGVEEEREERKSILQDQGWHPSSKPLREGRAASTGSSTAPTDQSPLYFQFRLLTDMGLLSPSNAHQVLGKWALSEWMSGV